MNFFIKNYTYLIIIYLYILPTLFTFLIINDLRLKKLNNINHLSGNFFKNLFFLIFLLNLAGLPPLPGFFLKLYLLNLFLKKINLITIVFLIVINFVAFYLYIRNYKNLTFIKKYFYFLYFSEKQYLLIVLFIFFMLFYFLFNSYFIIFLYHQSII